MAIRDKIKKKRGSQFRENWDQLARDLDATHRCGAYYQKAANYVTYPLKQIKRTPMYGGLRKLAESNRDYVFLAKVVGVLTFVGLIYFVYSWLTKSRGAPFSLDLLTSHLRTMDSSDLPMSETVDAQAEVDALKCHRSYFSKMPYSIENSGAFDLVRGVVLLPFIYLTINYILPVGAVIYLGWFIYNYGHYIARAIYGFITEVMIKYLTRFIVCKVASIIPMFSFKCPSLYGYIMKWKKKYVDEPVYREKIKYFRFYYLNKKRFYEKPKIKFVDQNWEKGRIKADYGAKFFARSKDIFYNQVMTTQERADQGTGYLQGKLSDAKRYGQSRYDQLTKSSKEKNDQRNRQSSWEKAEEKISSLYSWKNLLMSFTLLLISLGVLYFFTYYNITGRPSFIQQLVGPLYRSTDLGNRLKLLSSRYNWLAIALVIALILFLWAGGT
jgi:hypothetical protein